VPLIVIPTQFYFIDQNIITDTAKLGFPRSYIEKCLRENSNNHCTTTYYLLCMDQNFWNNIDYFIDLND